MRSTRLALAAAIVSLASATAAGAADNIVDIPYQTFTLNNGLTVIVHEDHKAPIVAVDLWYHVGSKNEPPGQTGYAHLFEHLMFQGSANYDDEFFKPFELVGATNQNGTTSFDRTNYFENVPTTALDLALWLESDRMGHLLGALDQSRLDEQRGVVENEKRQGDNQPYGKVFYNILKGVFPPDHPYAHETIGSMKDLDAASLKDVQNWFRTYYGPNNAVLVLAGDIDLETARRKVTHFFGAIPPGPPLDKPRQWIPRLDTVKREIMQDRVPQARIYQAWPGPAWGSRDATLLDLATSVLSTGKTSRLYKRLVYDEQVATDASIGIYPLEIGGMVYGQATAAPGGDIHRIEALFDEEVQKFLRDGPTAAELKRVKTEMRAAFIRGVERVGGYGGKADILAENYVYTGDPSHFKQAFQWIDDATAADVRDAARRWLGENRYILEVHPYDANLHADKESVDRSKLPYPDHFPSVSFPQFERATLDNGLKLIVAHRAAIPVVQFNLLIDAGYAADQYGQPGGASMAMSMLDEGTESRNALQISDEEESLGADISAGSGLDYSNVSLSALKDNLDDSLDLFADIVLHPSFPQSELARLKPQVLAQIQREKVSPTPMAYRVVPELLYGQGHAYSVPLTGSGTEESVRGMTREALQRFHDTWFRPNNATLVVVGDTTMKEIRPKLERLFAGWKPGDVPEKNIGTVARPDKPVIYLLDRPQAEQSLLIAATLMPPKSDPRDLAMGAAVRVLGDSYARLEMNLREDKHWAYYARAILVDARGQRPLLAVSPVQTDRTADALKQMIDEIQGISGDKPVTEQELNKVQRERTLSLPGRWETDGSIAGSIGTIVRYQLPDDYWRTYPQAVNNLKLEQVRDMADQFLKTGHMIYVVVGDRSVIQPKLEALGVAPVKVLDANGKPVDD